uniref:Uncharacterized protein n=1 Tax=Fagus sylvatica TaxID=28930 RepID=A0A2N9G052_FAGSY
MSPPSPLPSTHATALCFRGAVPSPLLHRYGPFVFLPHCNDLACNLGIPAIPSVEVSVLLATGLGAWSLKHLTLECPSKIAWSWLPWTSRFVILPNCSDGILPAYHLLTWAERIAETLAGFFVLCNQFWFLSIFI